MTYYRYAGVFRKTEPASLPLDIADHPLFKGTPSVTLISADQPKFPVLSNGGTKGLKEELDRKGVKYDQTIGHYDNLEDSFIVYDLPEPDALDLGKRYGQESVIWSEGGHHKFHFVNGSNEGLYHIDNGNHQFWKTQPNESYWTKMPGNRGFVQLGFDWNTFYHRGSQDKHNEETPVSKSEEKTKGLPELRKAVFTKLHEMLPELKKAIEAHEDVMLSLRKRELEKVSQLNTPTGGEPDTKQAEGKGPGSMGGVGEGGPVIKAALCKGCGKSHAPGKCELEKQMMGSARAGSMTPPPPMAPPAGPARGGMTPPMAKVGLDSHAHLVDSLTHQDPSGNTTAKIAIANPRHRSPILSRATNVVATGGGVVVAGHPDPTQAQRSGTIHAAKTELNKVGLSSGNFVNPEKIGIGLQQKTPERHRAQFSPPAKVSPVSVGLVGRVKHMTPEQHRAQWTPTAKAELSGLNKVGFMGLPGVAAPEERNRDKNSPWHGELLTDPKQAVGGLSAQGKTNLGAVGGSPAPKFSPPVKVTGKKSVSLPGQKKSPPPIPIHKDEIGGMSSTSDRGPAPQGALAHAELSETADPTKGKGFVPIKPEPKPIKKDVKKSELYKVFYGDGREAITPCKCKSCCEVNCPCLRNGEKCGCSGKEGCKCNTPTKTKEISAPGSGGEVKKGKLIKAFSDLIKAQKKGKKNPSSNVKNIFGSEAENVITNQKLSSPKSKEGIPAAKIVAERKARQVSSRTPKDILGSILNRPEPASETKEVTPGPALETLDPGWSPPKAPASMLPGPSLSGPEFPTTHATSGSRQTIVGSGKATSSSVLPKDLSQLHGEVAGHPDVAGLPSSRGIVQPGPSAPQQSMTQKPTPDFTSPQKKYSGGSRFGGNILGKILGGITRQNTRGLRRSELAKAKIPGMGAPKAPGVGAAKPPGIAPGPAGGPAAGPKVGGAPAMPKPAMAALAMPKPALATTAPKAGPAATPTAAAPGVPGAKPPKAGGAGMKPPKAPGMK